MRTIFILFDSLNRGALGCYGGDTPTPNFDRLAAKSTVFENHYIGSMPCMPARREIHTGRLNFLLRSWGPLEPFDDSFVVDLKSAGTYTHLVSDHSHYWEDGGATYHNRYHSYEHVRGNEDDHWIAEVNPDIEAYRAKYHERQFGGARMDHRIRGFANEKRFKTDKDYPLHKCFDGALDFLANNGHEDNWFLHLECFDPHEPFTAPPHFRDAFPTDYEGPVYTWPQYRLSSDDTKEEIAEVRANYAALVAFCDEQLGRLLDHLDDHDMWEDTAVVLTTDHGFMLSEHDWWGKLRMPFFNEIANIPLMVHDPTRPETWGTRNGCLTQTTDISATLLDFFGLGPCEDSLGRSILPLLREEEDCIRDIAVYGVFGGAVNATDGEYTYFLYPDFMEEKPIFEYTLMPVHQTSMYEIRELVGAELHPGFDFTKGAPVLKVPALKDAKKPPMQGGGLAETNTCLYNLVDDPKQMQPFRNEVVEARLAAAIAAEMQRHDVAPEVYDRFGLYSLSQGSSDDSGKNMP